MADPELTDSTGKWEPLKDYLRRRGISRHGPLRAEDPVGEYRFDNLFAMERERRPIRVRGYPEKIIGGPQEIPRVEFSGYLVDDRAGRLTHVASGVTWYAVEVLEDLPADASAAVKSAAEEPASVEDIVTRLTKFLNDGERMDETKALGLAYDKFGREAFTDKQWWQARAKTDPGKKIGRGKRK